MIENKTLPSLNEKYEKKQQQMLGKKSQSILKRRKL
jgi:hypothetical protein